MSNSENGGQGDNNEYNGEDYLIGQGFDSILGANRSAAVTGQIEHTTGVDTTHLTRVKKTYEEICKSLEIDSSVHVSYLGMGSVTNKMSFVSSLTITSHSVSVLVHVRAKTGSTKLSGVTAIKKQKPEDTSHFLSKHGDTYIDQIHYGAEYIGVYTFYAQSKDQQSEISDMLSGHGEYEGVSGSASVSTNAKNLHNSDVIESEFTGKMFGLDLDPPNAGEDLGTFPSKFFDQVNSELPGNSKDLPNHFTVIGTTTSDYRGVEGLDLDFAKIDATRTFFLGSTDSPQLGLAARHADALELRNSRDMVKHAYAFYGASEKTGSEFNDWSDALDADLKTCDSTYQKYRDDPASDFAQVTLESLSKGTPLIDFDIVDQGEWGGSGGKTQFGEELSIFQRLCNRQKITSIMLRGGTYVDHIDVGYVSLDNKTWTDSLGGTHGKNDKTILFNPNETISYFGGHFHNLLDHFEIKTTKGQHIEMGGGGGEFPINWAVPNDVVILGFKGAYDKFMNRISPIAARLKAVYFDTSSTVS